MNLGEEDFKDDLERLILNYIDDFNPKKERLLFLIKEILNDTITKVWR